MTLANVEPLALIRRHVIGDWCEMAAADRAANERASSGDERVFSSYALTPQVTVWVITEADRSSTCLLLPSDY
jgi:hypothetical protein